MAIKFALRSSYGLAAYYSTNGSFYGVTYKTNAAPTLANPGALTGVFGGGQVIDFSATSNIRGLRYVGLKNIGPFNGGITIRARFVPRFTGQPSNNSLIFAVGGIGTNNLSMIQVQLLSTGRLFFACYNNAGSQQGSGFISTGVLSMTSGTAVDFQLSWDGSDSNSASGTKTFYMSMDGVQVGTFAAPASMSIPSFFDWNQMTEIMLGSSNDTASVNMYLNELVIYDTALSPTYTVRTTYDGVTQFDAFASTDPGVANVRASTTYSISGVSLTGTAAIPAATDVRQGTAVGAGTGSLDLPAVSDVRASVHFDGATKTGTCIVPTAANTKHGVSVDVAGVGSYTGSDLWTDPGPTNVYLGLTYLANGVQQTGLMDEPSPTVVQHGVAYYEGQRTGTYRGADLWSDPGAVNVAAGLTYLANGVTLTGTNQVVTNVLAGQMLLGQGNISGTLKGD